MLTMLVLSIFLQNRVKIQIFVLLKEHSSDQTFFSHFYYMFIHQYGIKHCAFIIRGIIEKNLVRKPM